MSSKPFLIPGWEGVAAQRIYIRDSTRDGFVDLASVSVWNEASIPQYVDALCKSAARYLGPQQKVRAHGPVYTGTLEDALMAMPEDLRARLARRDPATIERVQSMIQVVDPRLLAEPMSFLHVEYGVFPRRDVEAKAKANAASCVSAILNAVYTRTPGKPRVGFQWAALIELDALQTIRPDARIRAHTIRPSKGLVTITKAHQAQVEEFTGECARAVQDAGGIGSLFDNSRLAWDSTIIPLAYRLAAGTRGPPQLTVYARGPPEPPRDN